MLQSTDVQNVHHHNHSVIFHGIIPFFANSPLACTFPTILNCHSSISSLIFTHCNQTLGYTSFLFSAFSEWGSSIKNNTIRSKLRHTEVQISANEEVVIVISIIIFITVSITFELSLCVLYFILIHV